MVSIAFIINNLNIGGAERLLIDKINNWPKGYDLHLILLQNDNPLIKDLRKDITIHLGFPKNKLGIIFKLLGVFRKYKIKYSFSHLERPNKSNVFATFFVSTKAIVVLHNINIYQKGSIKELITKIILKLFAKQVIGISPAVYNYLVNDLSLSPEKVKLIENGIDFKRIAKKQMLEKSASKSFFTLGRLVEAKGYDFMINAMKDSELMKFDWHLTIIGDGPLYSKLEERIINGGLSEHITLIGSKQNPFEFIKKGSIALMPSRREGLPIALLEIMSLGLPVIASNIKPLEIVKDSINGFKFISEDAHGFRRAFKKALVLTDKDYERLSAGAKNAVENNSIEACVNGYLKLIEK